MKKIREKKLHRWIPITGMSTPGEEGDILTELGAHGCMEKSFRPNLLYDLIGRIIPQKQALSERVSS